MSFVGHVVVGPHNGYATEGKGGGAAAGHRDRLATDLDNVLPDDGRMRQTNGGARCVAQSCLSAWSQRCS